MSVTACLTLLTAAVKYFFKICLHLGLGLGLGQLVE